MSNEFMSNDFQKFEYFDCQCSDACHTLRFAVDTEYGDISTEYYLRQPVWYKRLWIAVKYVFGYRSKYGDFDCTMLQFEEYDKLRNLLDESEKIRDEYYNKKENK